MKKKRVVIAMSGGVDSSVAAYLLKKENYDLVGMALQVTDYSKYHQEGSSGTCCSLQDMDDARRVCESLEIPFYVINTEKTFDKNVVEYFVEDYLNGKTPNPCVMCNTRVKFNHLYRTALDLGADYVATGHFSKIVYDDHLGACLYAGDDKNKDQSYFLFNLNQEQLKRTLFPLSRLTKAEVRKIAHENDLPVAFKPESQEICFVPNNDYARFIQDYVKDETRFKPGGIFSSCGKLLARHDGIHQFTIGQRKGLGEALNKARLLGLEAEGTEKLFVQSVDSETGSVYLAKNSDLAMTRFYLENVNWIVPYEKINRNSLEVKIRYRSTQVPANISYVKEKNSWLCELKVPKRAVSPGQACVFYDQEHCLGGAFIGDVLGPVL